MTFKNCRGCSMAGTYQDGSPACAKFKIPIDLDKDGCSWRISDSSSYKCGICGTPNNDNLYVYEIENEYHYICPNCYTALGTCNTCSHTDDCGLVKDNSKPTYVFQTVRQGSMTIQSQVLNPELVMKHCSNCKCAIKNDNPQGAPYTCRKTLQNDISCSQWQMRHTLLQSNSQ